MGTATRSRSSASWGQRGGSRVAELAREPVAHRVDRHREYLDLGLMDWTWETSYDWPSTPGAAFNLLVVAALLPLAIVVFTGTRGRLWS